MYPVAGPVESCKVKAHFPQRDHFQVAKNCVSCSRCIDFASRELARVIDIAACNILIDSQQRECIPIM